MKKVLYLSHVPWNWIKQRPQFLAEELAVDNRVDVCYYKSPRRSSKESKSSENQKINDNISFYTYFFLPLYKLPFIGKWKVCRYINMLFMRFQLPQFNRYDIIWLTSPAFYPQIKGSLSKRNQLVYDCMDDMAEFPDVLDNPQKKNLLLGAEKDILLSKSVVFCSSDYLKHKILSRANIDDNREVIVVNNALSMPKGQTTKLSHLPQDVLDRLKKIANLSNVLMYVGTISEWFDFDKIVRLLDEIESLNVVLIGPVLESVQIPQHGRIHELGPIPHDYIFLFMQEAKALIMPFVVNELIESVNPVKLYEYIYSGKPALAPLYSESEKFGDYVCLYRDYKELKQQVVRIVNGEYEAQSREHIEQYIASNDWGSRMTIIRKYLGLD